MEERMGERKYSVAEIDQMRHCIEWSYPSGVVYYGSDRTIEIEQRLRTYMLNGTEPEELEEMLSQRLDQQRAARASRGVP